MDEKHKIFLEEIIRQAVFEQLDEVSAVFYPAIKKGISKAKSPGADTEKSTSFEKEISDIETSRKIKQEMMTKMLSLSNFLKKHFSNKASGGTAAAYVMLPKNNKATVEIQPMKPFIGFKFVVTVTNLETDKIVARKSFGAGLGAKQNIVKFIKKFENMYS